MIIQNEFNKAGWGIDVPVELRFVQNLDIPEGQSVFVPAGMITSPFSGLGRTLSGKSNGALGVKFPEYPVSEEQVEMLIRRAGDLWERHEREGKLFSEEFSQYVHMQQIGWLQERVQDIRDTYFEESKLSPPTLAFSWDLEQTEFDPFYCHYNRIKDVEAIMSGQPNGHPHWDGQSSDIQ